MTVRTWIITGVNRSFGRRMTEQLPERGERVAGTTRSRDSLIILEKNEDITMKIIDTGRRAVLSIGIAATLFALFSVALFSAPLALAQSATDTIASNKQKVGTALTAWSRGTGSILSVLSDDIKWTIPGHSLIAGTTVGKDELNAKINVPFAARFARSNDKFRPVSIRGIYGDGDMVIVNFQGRGIANDGKPYVNNYAWLLKMKDGLVVEGTAFFDSVAFNDFWTRVPVNN